MEVKELMSTKLLTIDANEPLRNAIRLMEKKRVSRLLVRKKKKIVGIITARDLARRLGDEKERKLSDGHIFVSSCYSKELIKIGPEEDVKKAARLMLKHGISSLVVEKDGEIVGLVTKTDLIKALKDDKTEVRKIMNKDVKRIRPDGSLLQARKMMFHYGIKRIVVMEDDKLVGIITEGDIARALGFFRKLAEGKQWDEKMKRIEVNDVMSREVVTISPSSTLAECVEKMIKNDISGLPVVENGKVVGIVTKTDLVKYLATIQ